MITLTRNESIPDSKPPDNDQGGSGNPSTGVIGGVSIGTAFLIGALSIIRYRNKDDK